jgi:NAD+ synthase
MRNMMRKIDLVKEIDRIVDFIARYVHSAGLENAVLGLSGGVDSGLSAALATRALGKEHVFGVMLPWKNSQPASYEDALTVANRLGIQHEKIPITPMVEAYFNNYQAEAATLRLGNWMARTRMCVLYDLSAKYKALVVGTSNRTELLVGYFTQYGDGACAFEPIGHLYKTEVWDMAKLLDLPEQVINKTPTADLWAGQTDEAELGISYLRLDEILYAVTEQKVETPELIAAGFTEAEVIKVRNLMQRTEFKRNLPPLIDDFT